jgi:hypothetical protein
MVVRMRETVGMQLQRKLVWFYSGWLEDDLDVFDPPMD